MNNRIIFMGLILLSLFTGALMPDYAMGSNLRITMDGRSDYIIQVSPGADITERFAAEELQKYLGKITGVTIPVDSGSVIIREPAILIGKNFALENGYSEKLGKITVDGFLVTTKGKNLFMAGNMPRATLYAVYEFLERAGCRWLAPGFDFYKPYDGEYIPETRELTVENQDYIINPSMKIRSKDGGEGISYNTPGDMIRVFDWLAKQKLNTFCYQIDFQEKGINPWEKFRKAVIPEARKRGIILEIGGHGWQLFLRQDKYFSKHSEWFGTINGKPVRQGNYVFNTANPEALETLAKEIISYLKNHPEIDVFDCWPPDGTRWSDDPAGIAQGTPAVRHAIVINYLSRRIKEELPGIKLQFISYNDFLVPPATIKYEDDLLMEFCPSGRSYKYPIWSPENTENIRFYKALREWLKPGVFPGDISIYTYYRKYVWGSLPVIIPDLITREIRFYKELGVNGIRMYGEPDDWLTYELNHYAHAKAVWNTGIPADEIIRDFCIHRYGAAAGLMINYFRLAEETYPKCLSIPQSQVKSLEEMEGYAVNLESCGSFLDRAAVVAGTDSRVKELVQKLKLAHEYALCDYRLTLEGMKVGKVLLWVRPAPTELVKYYNSMRSLFFGNPGKGVFLQREGWYPKFELKTDEPGVQVPGI